MRPAISIKSAIPNPFPSRIQIWESRTPLLLCLLSGLFGAVLFQQNVLGLLGWIALVPLFFSIHRLRGKVLAWATFLFGFTWYYLGTFWLHTLVVFHWLIPLGVFAGAVYYALYFLLFAFPAAWCCRHLRPAFRPWAIAVCWTAVEYLRSFTDMAFPWNLLGHSQAPSSPVVMHLASIGGVYLISFLMALINAAVAVAVVQGLMPGENRRKALLPSVAPVIFAILVIGLLGQWTTPSEGGDQSLKVSVIQPGTSQLKKYDALMGVPGDTPESFQRRFRATDIEMQETAGSLIREAARQDQPRLIVLPESVFLSGYFPYETELHSELTSLARQLDADLFFGADNRIERSIYDKLAAQGQRFLLPGDVPTTTALPVAPIFVSDDGTTMVDMQREHPMALTVAAWHVSARDGLEPRVYNKMQLVPFGEMVPFINDIDWLRNYLETSGIAGAFKPGMQNTIFEVDGAKFGAVICFESTFSYLTRHLALAGSQFICVLTNDAWYDPEYAISRGGFWGTLFRIPGLHQLASAGPGQHLVQSRFRAIETGLPVVRSANTGISALIDRNGRITDKLPYSQGGFLSGKIMLQKKPVPTFAVRYGEWVGLICAGLWLAVFLRVIAGRLRKLG